MEQTIEFPNKHGERLIGRLKEGQTTKTVVLCHGYSDHKDTRLLKALAEGLQQSALCSFRFDFSGNGESEGEFEFGNYSKEKEDIKSAIEFLRENQNKEIVGLVGHSKGANDVLLYAAAYDDVPMIVNVASRFDMGRGIIQRFGADVIKKVEEQGEAEVPRVTPEKNVVKYKLTKKSLDERLSTDMKSALGKIQQSRVLTIHGDEDKVIPVEDARSIATCVKNHELYLIGGADHNFSQNSHLQILTDKVVQFFSTYPIHR